MLLKKVLSTAPTYSIQVTLKNPTQVDANTQSSPHACTLYQIDSFNSSRNFSPRRQPPYTQTQLIRVGEPIASPLGELTSAGSQSISLCTLSFSKTLLGTYDTSVSVLASGNIGEALDPVPTLMEHTA